jgi:hypothetical protein
VGTSCIADELVPISQRGDAVATFDVTNLCTLSLTLTGHTNVVADLGRDAVRFCIPLSTFYCIMWIGFVGEYEAEAFWASTLCITEHFSFENDECIVNVLWPS